MINLIRNELTKISKKKGIYITLLVTLGFMILVNVVYKVMPNAYNNDLSGQIKFYEEQLKNLDIKKAEDAEIYEIYKVELDLAKLIQKYGGESSWQAEIIRQNGRPLISEIVRYRDILQNEAEYQKSNKKYEILVEKLDKNDWKYFANENLKEIEQSLEEQNKAKSLSTNKAEINQIENQIKQLEIEKQILKWRLEKDICYGHDYKNQCLSTYKSANSIIMSYEENSNIINEQNDNDKEKYIEKQNYYDALEKVNISKYDIENGTNRGETNTARGVLLNVISEFEMFIIIMCVMIAGTIVSEEFSKGTVKLLLIKPYKRRTILTSKFITSIIMLIIVMTLVIFMQFIVGGIIHGFDSYQEPAMIYNHDSNKLEEMSIIKYLALQAIGKMPIYILLLTLAFSISTIFANSALAIAITLLGSMSSSMINMLAEQFNLTWIKFFVTPNWDLTQYFFGRLPGIQGLTMGFSITIIAIYMIVMLVPTYILFKKKNIKNI